MAKNKITKALLAFCIGYIVFSHIWVAIEFFRTCTADTADAEQEN